MRIAEVEARIRAALAGSLPGVDAHLALAPRPRHPGWKPGFLPDDARRAAALVLIYPVDARAHLVLTLRADDVPLHRGQVSLPGGGIDAGESIEAAALREAQEEIGLDPAAPRVLGRLTPVHIIVSGFVLYPVVAVCEDRPALEASEREVARLLEVSLEELADPARLGLGRRIHEGREIEVPYFNLDGAQLWGATAMVVSELLRIVANRPATPFD